MLTEQAQWYVQKGARILGPFSVREVGRFLLLGRVRSTDRVSRDGELWEPVTQVPELIPEELLDLESNSGWSRFLEVRDHHNERQQPTEIVSERRGDDAETVSRIRDEWVVEAPEDDSSLLPWSLLGITLAALAVVLYLNASAGIAG